MIAVLSYIGVLNPLLMSCICFPYMLVLVKELSFKH